MKITNTILSCLPAHVRKKLVRVCLPELPYNIRGILFHQAITPTEQESCLKLVHNVYVNAGYIADSTDAGCIRRLPYHNNPKTKILMATCLNQWEEEIPVYTASIFPDSAIGLPADSGFKKQIDLLRQQGRRLVEIGCLASHPYYRKGDQRIPMLMNRLLFKESTQFFFADDIVITTHPKYLKIYEDILLFEKIGEISSFSYVNNNPAVALRVNLNTLPERMKKIYGHLPLKKNLYQYFFGV